MRQKLLNEIALKYLKDKGLDPETASEAQKSDAKSYASCYQWYLDTQKVTTNTAELASDVWVSKYALHNSEGVCLENTPEDMWNRIATALANEEIKTNKTSTRSFDEWKAEFFNLLTSWKYVPGGSGLYAIGNKYVESSASNCFVWDGAVHGDSLEGIMETAKNMSTIYKYRGGCGIDISHLRPEGSSVSNAAKTSSGAASFMDFFSTVTATVGQCNRRGALMQSIRVDHPDIFKFIEEKRDKDKQWFFNELLDSGINLNEFKYFSIAQRLKSTSNANVSVKLTDKFIKAVEEDTDFELWYEFEDNKYPRISKMVRALDIWNALIEAATDSAEPGMFNWDYLLAESVTDSYSSKTRHSIVLDGVLTDVTYSSRTISTNPCLSGDTLVAVADGRGSVTIKELAESGTDVPVYCLDTNKRIAIRTMRNPRITGYNQPMIKITFEGNHEVKCTLNHKILMSDGRYKEAKDIIVGDGVSAFYKEESCLKHVFPAETNNPSLYYHWKNPFQDSTTVQFEHRLIYEHYMGSIPYGHVIHHKDYDSRNNAISNLQCMSKAEHDKFHARDMLGEKNPVFKVLADPERAAKWKKNLSVACTGALNGNCYSTVTNEYIYSKALELTAKLGRRFSSKEWQVFAKENNLPVAFTEYHEKDLGTQQEMAYKAAIELSVPYPEEDPRLVTSYLKMLEQGYKAEIVDGHVLVERTCEYCGNAFKIPHERREVSFCSLKCSSKHVSQREDLKEQRLKQRDIFEQNKSVTLRFEQAKTLLDLSYSLNRQPLKKEWEDACREKGIAFRLGGSKHMYKNYAEVLEASKNINHKVIKVELCEPETVYNGTVDEFHNFFVGCFEELNDKGNRKLFHINNLNCGELPLSHGDSCCLGSFYLPAFVKDAWTPNAIFDFHSFISAVKLGTRAQDNIKNIDLDKVPLKENKIAGILLRRIGLGCHGLADMLAALGLKYDTDEAVEFASKVYETLKNTVYSTSVELGKEKGVAPIWEWELEKDNPFLNRLDPGVLQSIKEFGRRNIACLTNAPTGSLSILSRNCSSGIEPVFKKAYERTVKLAGSLETSKYTLYHQAVQDCIDAGGNPDIFVEANDVDPHKKIDLQAALQKHIDHSISVTTNLPAGTTKETVSKLYLEAFKKGCKGFTIYVDGSRSGILNAQTKETDVEPKVNDSKYIERPKTTDVDIFKTKYKDNMYMILVGKLPDGTPIECFGGLEDGVSLPTKYEKATLVKKSRGHYTLNIQLSEDEEDILRVNNIINRFPAKDLVTITRMVSLALRHRIPVSDIVEQLQRGASSMYDAPAVFARVLKNYISDDEFNTHQKAKGVVCPKCGGELIFKRESGCVTEQCTSCNHFSSKCG